MILIADSGSTKTDWRIIDKQTNIVQARTVGINPYHQTEEQIAQILLEELLPQIQTPVEQAYFYGAGCATEEARLQVQKAFSSVFHEAEISVYSDLFAAARALCGHDPGIACIIGTGSNSCLYDGQDIIDNIPALGYILGDEGSATYLGRELLNRFLKRDMPEPLRQQFEKRYQITLAEVLEHVYQKPQANRYLAGFSRFAFHHLKHPYIVRLVYDGFVAFFEKNVCKYQNYQQHKVHFTGSVAFYYSNVLRQVANDKGIVVQNILENPIAGLTLYHQKT